MVMRIPHREKDSLEGGASRLPFMASPPAQAAKEAEPELALGVVEPNPDLAQFQSAAGGAAAIRQWKADTAAWEQEYAQSHTGPDAGKAVDDARAFQQQYFRDLREKYSDNPLATRYMRDAGNDIGNRSIGRMSAYSEEEAKRAITQVLDLEEQDLRQIMNSPDAPMADRRKALENYLFKTKSWRKSQGETPEVITAWERSFRRDLVAGSVESNFSRLIEHDPDQAVRVIRMAAAREDAPGGRGGDMTPDVKPDVDAPYRSLPSDIAQAIPPERRRRLEHQAVAAQGQRRRERDNQSAAIRRETPAQLRNAMGSGDFAPIRQTIGNLRALDRNGEADALQTRLDQAEDISPYLAGMAHLSPTRQREQVESAIAGAGLDQATAAQWRDNAELVIREREERLSRDPVQYLLENRRDLSEPGLSHEEFLLKNKLSPEGWLSRLRQAQSEAGIQAGPLPGRQAGELRDQWSTLQDAPQNEKSAFLTKLAGEYGKYTAVALEQLGMDRDKEALRLFPQWLAGSPDREPDWNVAGAQPGEDPASRIPKDGYYIPVHPDEAAAFADYWGTLTRDQRVKLMDKLMAKPEYHQRAADLLNESGVMKELMGEGNTYMDGLSPGTRALLAYSGKVHQQADGAPPKAGEMPVQEPPYAAQGAAVNDQISQGLERMRGHHPPIAQTEEQANALRNEFAQMPIADRAAFMDRLFKEKGPMLALRMLEEADILPLLVASQPAVPNAGNKHAPGQPGAAPIGSDPRHGERLVFKDYLSQEQQKFIADYLRNAAVPAFHSEERIREELAPEPEKPGHPATLTRPPDIRLDEERKAALTTEWSAAESDEQKTALVAALVEEYGGSFARALEEAGLDQNEDVARLLPQVLERFPSLAHINPGAEPHWDITGDQAGGPEEFGKYFDTLTNRQRVALLETMVRIHPDQATQMRVKKLLNDSGVIRQIHNKGRYLPGLDEPTRHLLNHAYNVSVSLSGEAPGMPILTADLPYRFALGKQDIESYSWAEDYFNTGGQEIHDMLHARQSQAQPGTEQVRYRLKTIGVATPAELSEAKNTLWLYEDGNQIIILPKRPGESEEDSVRRYRERGQHAGIFSSQDQANKFLALSAADQRRVFYYPNSDRMDLKHDSGLGAMAQALPVIVEKFSRQEGLARDMVVAQYFRDKFIVQNIVRLDLDGNKIPHERMRAVSTLYGGVACTAALKDTVDTVTGGLWNLIDPLGKLTGEIRDWSIEALCTKLLVDTEFYNTVNGLLRLDRLAQADMDNEEVFVAEAAKLLQNTTQQA